MKHFAWNEQKNRLLKANRDISFELIVSQMEMGMILDIVEHPNPARYGNQKIFIVEYAGYAFLVPFVEDDEKIFLKTIIPSRQATKMYLRMRNNG